MGVVCCRTHAGIAWGEGGRAAPRRGGGAAGPTRAPAESGACRDERGEGVRRAGGAHRGCRVRAGLGAGAGTVPALAGAFADAADSKQARLWRGVALDGLGASRRGGHAALRPGCTGTAGIRSRPAGWKMAGRGGERPRASGSRRMMSASIGTADLPGSGLDGPPVPCRGRCAGMSRGRGREGGARRPARRAFAPYSRPGRGPSAVSRLRRPERVVGRHNRRVQGQGPARRVRAGGNWEWRGAATGTGRLS